MQLGLADDSNLPVLLCAAESVTRSPSQGEQLAPCLASLLAYVGSGRHLKGWGQHGWQKAGTPLLQELSWLQAGLRQRKKSWRLPRWPQHLHVQAYPGEQHPTWTSVIEGLADLAHAYSQVSVPQVQGLLLM